MTDKQFSHLDVRNENFGECGFFEFILENSTDEIFVTDGQGVTIYCNPAFEDHYGLKREDIIGQPVFAIQEKGVVDHILVAQVIESKKSMTITQETTQGKIILNTIKPILDDKNEVIFVIENCRDISKMSQIERALRLQRQDSDKKTHHKPVDTANFLNFNSPSMRRLEKTIKNLAAQDVTMLLLGETGTGKTYLASKIHQMSQRFKGPFTTIHCTTIPENLIESELFGYSKGSFTGARSQGKEGLVEQADKGTLFLDEIGELPFNVQSKLLQLVQEKTFTPIGSTEPKTVDIRIIAATNQDLKKLIAEGKFREDLYYRLALGVITVPPLRERREDIVTLIHHYLDHFNKKYETQITLSANVVNCLMNYDWPGNIRELEHLIEYLVVNSFLPNEIVAIDNLPMSLQNDPNIMTKDMALKDVDYHEIGLKERLDHYEAAIVRSAYKDFPTSYKLADHLNVSQSTAHRLIKKYCE